MKYLKRTVQLCALGILCFSCGIFNKSASKNYSNVNATNFNKSIKNGADTLRKNKRDKLKVYEDVITKNAVSSNGLFKVHLVEDRYFFEIPNAMLNRDLLVVNRISKGASGTSSAMLGYAGDQVNETLIQLSKGSNHKLFIKRISYTERAIDTSDNGMYRSVLNSGLQPIIAAFDVKALSKDSTGLVIDVTDYLNADNEVLLFDSKAKTALKLGSLQADKSYINSVKAYAENVEMRTTKTYSRIASASPFGAPTGGGNATFEMNSSIVLLPEQPMNTRFYDDRVGYFATGHVDFDANPQGVKQVNMITRWRLEPADADKERYLRGELVHPKRQIIFYIDPATPRKWMPYLIQGINDWNIAFEQAGFKNAILAKEAPSYVQDSTWSIDDARHNVIVYKPSTIPNASGPHVHDPRTGEILETHVNWYHNVMQLLRNWYLIQAGVNDPRARKMKFDDELMGQLIRFVSSHEIGHTLGLRHNFGSSSTVPVEKLRDKAWVEANGHTPSIMDYARFNYVAQPEDGISEKGIFPRIGDYDKWAIEWGYRWWPEMPRAEEQAMLNKWIIEKTSGNKRLWFGTESDTSDPRAQNEDLGDDAMKAGTYGIKNLQRTVPRLMEWTNESNEGYDNLKMMYGETVNQYKRYIGHVIKNIGGVMTTPKTVEQKGAVYVGVSKTIQKQAVNWLQQQVFKTPVWLLEKEIIGKAGIDQVNLINSIQSPVLDRLLSAVMVNRLINAQVQFPADAYNPVTYLSDVERGVWSELSVGHTISIYRRNLQKSYLTSLLKLCGIGVQSPPMPAGMPAGAVMIIAASVSDATSIGKAQLKQLRFKIKVAIPQMTDQMSRYHLQDCLDKIDDALKQKNI